MKQISALASEIILLFRLDSNTLQFRFCCVCKILEERLGLCVLEHVEDCIFLIEARVQVIAKLRPFSPHA